MAREPNLLAWQWASYPRNHTNKANLLLHMAAVPAFVGGALAALNLALHGLWLGVLVCLGFALLAFLAQGIGHKWEREPPIPFDGPADALSRVLAEQFVTFPRFVLTGGWLRAMTAAPTERGSRHG